MFLKVTMYESGLPLLMRTQEVQSVHQYPDEPVFIAVKRGLFRETGYFVRESFEEIANQLPIRFQKREE